MISKAITFPATLLLSLGALQAAAADISVKGSDTMVILAQRWAEVYMRQHPDVQIQVTGGGSGTGLAALQNQQTDLCNASRPIRAMEIASCIKTFGKRPLEYKVAMDGVSVYVNPANPVDTLTLDQLALIFTGRIRNWREVGGRDAPIVLYSRENSSGTYLFFKQIVLQHRDYAANAQTMPGTAAVLQAVAKDKNGIGYGGAAYGAGFKCLSVGKSEFAEAILPTEEAVVTRTYPLSRYLYIYVNPALNRGAITAYLEWIRSPDGQQVVRDIGYFPLPESLQQKG